MAERPPQFSLAPDRGPKTRWSGVKVKRRRSSWRRGYGAEWQKLRRYVLNASPRCNWPGCEAAATDVDHILARRWGGTDDLQNLQALCGFHHKRKTHEEQNAIARTQPRDLLPVLGPLVIVSGAPASGKTTLAAGLVGRERCIDLDVIKSALAGTAIHNTQGDWVAPALVLRNHMLRALSMTPFEAPVALIIGAPKASERARWRHMLKPSISVVMETPVDETIRRIRTDPQRDHCVNDHVDWVMTWWRRYSKGSGELAVTPANEKDAVQTIKKSLKTKGLRPTGGRRTRISPKFMFGF